MKNLIRLTIITILCFSVGSCKEVDNKNENVIFENLYFTVLKLDNGKYIILPKDNNDRSVPIVIDEKDYQSYKCNFNINK